MSLKHHSPQWIRSHSLRSLLRHQVPESQLLARQRKRRSLPRKRGAKEEAQRQSSRILFTQHLKRTKGRRRSSEQTSPLRRSRPRMSRRGITFRSRAYTAHPKSQPTSCSRTIRSRPRGRGSTSSQMAVSASTRRYELSLL